MNLKAVPFRSPSSAYEQQAESLLAGHRAADPAAIDLFHRKHPRFLDEKIKWRPKSIAASDIRDAVLTLDDARLAVARTYDFLDPASNHPHTTPLHQAVLGGHEAVVRLLVERGARLDIRDTIWQGTPLGWALYGGGRVHPRIAECLRSLGAAEQHP